MSLLAAIASDPMAIPLWLTFLFAASMYPVGMFLGCRPCCRLCRLCCRDEVSQVVVDFALEATGEQLIKQTPFGLSLFNGGSATIDGVSSGYANYGDLPPMFRLEGQTSGARLLCPAVNNGDGGTQVPPEPDSYSPSLLGVWMGSASEVEFSNGESVSVTPLPSLQQVEAASLTAVVSECPDAYWTFNGTPGKWRNSWSVFSPNPPPPPVDLTVDCQGDEGTIVFDVVNQKDRAPGVCEQCNIVVERSMAHPMSFVVDPCADQAGIHELWYEQSGLSVDVPLMQQGPATCGAEIVATAEESWGFIGAGCVRTTTYTLTAADQNCVPFSAWPSEVTEQGPFGDFDEQLVTLTTPSLPCLGFGFQGRAVQPAGIPGTDDGPITEVEVISGGSGYAVLGRVEPTVTISSANGSGADFTVTMAGGFEDNCGRPVWAIDSVAIGSGGGGSGYVENETLIVTVDSPGIQYGAAALVANCGREEPEVVLSDSNSDLTFTFTENAGPPKTWTVDTISVVDGGSGHQYGDVKSIVGKTAADQLVSTGFGQITTVIDEPTLTLLGGSGVNASLTVALTSNGGAPETWSISSVTITAGGSGYVVGDDLIIERGDSDIEVAAASVSVASVDGNGAITGVTINASGTYYQETGVIDSVVVYTIGPFSFGGAYFRSSGEIESVTIVSGGGYYLEDASVPALVSDITIEVHQLSPSDGTGAEISAVVDDDPASPTFGQITGLTIDDGGTNYLARRVEDGECVGPGGVWRSFFNFCGATAGESANPPRGVLWRRGCPFYTHEITLQ